MGEVDHSIQEMWRDMLTNRESPLYKKGRIFKHVPGDPAAGCAGSPWEASLARSSS